MSRDLLPRFERFVRDRGVPDRHAEFFRHVFVELATFLDGQVLDASDASLDAFLAAKASAGLTDRRQRAYRHVLDLIGSFRTAERPARAARPSGAVPRVPSGALDSHDLLQHGLGFHAAASLDDDAPEEMPGESTRAINDAPLLARSAMAAVSRGDEQRRSVFDPGARPTTGNRHQRLASLDHGRYEDSDAFYDRLGGDRSSTAIPDFMEAAPCGPTDHDDDEDDDGLFDPLLEGDGSLVNELITFDGDPSGQRPARPISRSTPRRSPSGAGNLPAARAAHAAPTPIPRAASRSRLGPLDDDDDDELLPAASARTRVPTPPASARVEAAAWARAGETREALAHDDLPAERFARAPAHDLPRPREAARPVTPQPVRVARHPSQPAVRRAAHPLDAGSTPASPRQAVSAHDPLGLFDDLPAPAAKPASSQDPLGLFDDLPVPAASAAGRPDPLGLFDDLPAPASERPDPLNPRPAAPPPPSAFLAAPVPPPEARNPAMLFQASASVAIEAPALQSAASSQAGFERGATMKGVGAIPKRGSAVPPTAASAAPPSGTAAPARSASAPSITAAPVGGAVAFSKLGLLEPSDEPGSIEVADDDELPAAASIAISREPSGSGPSLRTVDVPTEAVRNARPLPGAEVASREDAMRRARKRLSKTIEKASAEPTESATVSRGGKRFRPFVYDGRFVVDRPAPRPDGAILVAPGPESAPGPVIRLALVPLLLTLSGLALLALGALAALGSGPLAALGSTGWAVAAVGGVLTVALGLPTARWLTRGLRPLQRHTPDAALRSYHEALWVGNFPLARRCLAISDEAPPIPDDFDVRQKRCIEEAFNRLDAAAFSRYWFIQHPQARWSGLRIFRERGRPIELGECRLVAGAVDTGAVLLLVEMPDRQHYWLVPLIRLEGLWYLADGQLYWREVTDGKAR